MQNQFTSSAVSFYSFNFIQICDNFFRQLKLFIKMNTPPILLLITMSAILMVKCTGGHFLVDIDDAKEKRQENCLTDGSAFCDAQSPCCDGSFCVLIGMITQCAKKNSGNGVYDCDIDEINKNCDPDCLPGSCLDDP